MAFVSVLFLAPAPVLGVRCASLRPPCAVTAAPIGARTRWRRAWPTVIAKAARSDRRGPRQAFEAMLREAQ